MKKEWNLDEFQEPRNKNILDVGEETWKNPTSGHGMKPKKRAGRPPGKSKVERGHITVYMPKTEEDRFRREAADMGLNASAFLYMKLKQMDQDKY